MCRLYGFRANELTKVECSLVYAQNALLAQSRKDARGQRHADGWGIACYGNGRIPELVRHETAAFDDTLFSRQAETMYAQTVVAHVRLATVGYVGSLNSHPFTHDGWSFAHNGTLPGFAQLATQLAAETGALQNFRLGATDSEQLFLWLLSRLRDHGINLASPDSADITRCIAEAIREIDRRCRELETQKTPRLTFVLTNGRLLLGCRWHNSLHLLERNGIHDCEICGIPHIRHQDSVNYRAVVLASEPITDENWTEVPESSLSVVDEHLQVTHAKLSEGVQL